MRNRVNKRESRLEFAKDMGDNKAVRGKTRNLHVTTIPFFTNKANVSEEIESSWGSMRLHSLTTSRKSAIIISFRGEPKGSVREELLSINMRISLNPLAESRVIRRRSNLGKEKGGEKVNRMTNLRFKRESNMGSKGNRKGSGRKEV